MITQAAKDRCRGILLAELIPALGCTEPISLALAGAKAKEVLAEEPKQITVFCSGNIIKNVMGVTIPNSGGHKGVLMAVALGVAVGDGSAELEVLSQVSDEQRDRARQLIESGIIDIQLAKGVANLYIRVEMQGAKHQCLVELQNHHKDFRRIEVDGELITGTILEEKVTESANAKNDLSENSVISPMSDEDLAIINLHTIIEFADSLDFTNPEDKALQDLLQKQVECNSAIAQAGIEQAFGAQIGRTKLAMGDKHKAETRAVAYAAAGSDARMNGCSMPVVINCGSGNQGITVSLPVYEFYKQKQDKYGQEKLYRALAVANLVAIYQKMFIGRLSAFCGVLSAAAASGAGIGYLKDMGEEAIGNILTNTLATAGGMVCDGAKSSCASKIAISVENMVMALRMAEAGHTFKPGDGIVGQTIEETIRNVGHMAHQGMFETDIEILNIMLGKTKTYSTNERSNEYPGPVC